MNHYWLLFIGFFALGYVCAGRGDSFPTTIMKGFALFAVVAGIALFLSGCTTHEVKVSAPQLDTVGEAMKKIVIADCAKPTLAMPPIPQECVLDIRGDVLTASSQECENLIRFYVRARSLLKPAVAGTTTP